MCSHASPFEINRENRLLRERLGDGERGYWPCVPTVLQTTRKGISKFEAESTPPFPFAQMAVVCTGWLTKRGDIRKNWKRRYFVLEANGFLKYYGTNVDAAAKNLIDLRTVSVITTGSNLSEWPESSNPGCRLALVTKKRVLYFYSETTQECSTWLEALNRIAAEVCSLDPTKRFGSRPPSKAPSVASTTSIASAASSTFEPPRSISIAPTTTTTTSLTLAASPPLSNPPSGLPSPRSSTSTFPSAAPSRLIEPVRFDCGGDAAARTPPRHVNRQTSTAARIHLLTEGLNDEIWTAAENSSFVSVWSTTENRQLSEWMLDNPDLNKPKGVCCLILARDAIWAGLQRGSVYVWDALTHLPLLEIQYHQEAVRALLPISRHLVCSGSTDADKPLVLWRTFAPGRLPHQQVSGHFVDTVTLGQPASLRLIDRFGCVLSLTNEFDNEVDDDLGTSVPHDMLRRVQARQRASREREAIWTELLALPTIDEMRWRELLLHGLPDVEGQRLRKAAWLQLVDKHVGHIRRANPDFYTKNRNDQSCEQIELDLLRTMPLNQYFSSTDASGINKLRRVLAALSCYSAETSYCQGFNFLAALALLFLTEEDAFWALVAVVTVLMPKGYYTAPMLAARADQRVIRDLIRERLPKLDVFLKDVDVCMQTFQWFFTIFVEPAPTALSVRVWDLFLLDGNIVLHRFAFALFQQFEERIMQIQDRIELHMYVKNLLRNVTDIDLLCDLAAQVDLPDLEERRVRAIELIRKEDQDADADCAMRRRSRSSATARTDTPSDHAGGPTPRPTTTTPRPPTTSPPPSTPQPVSFTPQPSGGSEGKDESELDVERKRSDSGAVGGASVSEAGRASDHMFESLSPPHNFTNTSTTAAHCSTPARKHAPAPSLATTLAFSPALTAGSGPAPAPALAPELRVTAARPISPETHTSGSGGSGGSGQEGLSVSRADTTLTSGNRTIVDSAFDEKDHIDIPQRHGRQPGSIILSSSGPTPGRAGYGLAGSVGTVMDAGARRAPSDAVSLASDVTATDHSTSDGPFQLDEDYFS
eukprot:m.211013 g.211013  ORF g.211013 m.211013 type:complete len:1045 (+) comp15559_c1_seq12:5915-9049(+)